MLRTTFVCLPILQQRHHPITLSIIILRPTTSDDSSGRAEPDLSPNPSKQSSQQFVLSIRFSRQQQPAPGSRCWHAFKSLIRQWWQRHEQGRRRSGRGNHLKFNPAQTANGLYPSHLSQSLHSIPFIPSRRLLCPHYLVDTRKRRQTEEDAQQSLRYIIALTAAGGAELLWKTWQRDRTLLLSSSLLRVNNPRRQRSTQYNINVSRAITFAGCFRSDTSQPSRTDIHQQSVYNKPPVSTIVLVLVSCMW